MNVKQLSCNDFETANRIFHSVFEHKWKQDFDTAWNSRLIPASLGAYSEDGKLLAYAITTEKSNLTGPYWFLEFLGVAPEAQGSGLGTLLLQTLLQSNPRIGLVPLNHEPLIRWYTKHGFRIVSKQTDKFGDPEYFMSTMQISV